MSTTWFATSVILAFTLGITLATILVWIVGTDTEESDAARRAALGRAAARARTQSPPVQSTEMVDRGTTRIGLPVVVDERMPPGVAVLVGPDGLASAPLFIGRGWDNVLGYSEAGDGGWVDEENAKIEAQHAETVQRVEAHMDERETEQELAARVAIGGAHGDWRGTDETRLLLCHEPSPDGDYRCTLPRGHASKHQAGPLSGDAA